jgi:hypothetical protein
MFLGGLLA